MVRSTSSEPRGKRLEETLVKQFAQIFVKHRLLSAFAVLSLVICGIAMCWRLSAARYRRILVVDKWDDRRVGIQVSRDIFGWTRDGLCFGRCRIEVQANSPDEIDAVRKTAQMKIGQQGIHVWKWVEEPPSVTLPFLERISYTKAIAVHTYSFIGTAGVFGGFAAVISFFLIIKETRAAREKNSVGCCRKCGYDLRASPDRCPECGTIVERCSNSMKQQSIERSR